MKHEMIGLSETWIEEKQDVKVSNRLREYWTFTALARKEKRRGKAKDGPLVCWENLDGMTVSQMVDSDHMPTVIKMKCNERREKEARSAVRETRKVQDWLQNGLRHLRRS